MSDTRSEYHNLGQDGHHLKKDVKWIPNFLQWKYFASFCLIHGKALSKFCTTCEAPLCPQCVKGIDQDHQGHGIVQISRYEGIEAVRSSLISNYIHCHDIQPYISNRTPVLVLHPMLPLGDTGSSNSSGERNKTRRVKVNKQCGLCGNKLNSDDQSIRFCSIYCKVTAYAHSSDDSMPTLFVVPKIEPAEENEVDGNDNIHDGGEEVEEDCGDTAKEGGQGKEENPDEDGKQSYHRRSRKGTPHRAPFF